MKKTLLAMLMIIGACGRDGKDGADGKSLSVVSNTICTYGSSTQTLYTLDYSKLSSGDQFIKCLMSTSNYFQTITNAYLDKYNSEGFGLCILPLKGYDADNYVQFSSINNTIYMHASSLGIEWQGDMDCETN